MDATALLTEVTYKATRSSGPGGQHVNKTSTRVELHWYLDASDAVSEVEKERLRTALANRLSKDGLLLLSAEDTRSQLKNKAIVTAKFVALLEKAVVPPQKRKIPRVPMAIKRERLLQKRQNAEKKASRRKPLW